jgi:hypothetical protein
MNLSKARREKQRKLDLCKIILGYEVGAKRIVLVDRCRCEKVSLLILHVLCMESHNLLLSAFRYIILYFHKKF